MSAIVDTVNNYQYALKAPGEIEYVISCGSSSGGYPVHKETQYISATQHVKSAINNTISDLVELYHDMVVENQISSRQEFNEILSGSLRVVVSFFKLYTSISGVELLPAPAPSIMNDGQVVLEWITTSGRFSLQFTTNRVLVYALVHNGIVTYGQEYLLSGIPDKIRSLMLQLSRLS